MNKSLLIAAMTAAFAFGAPTYADSMHQDKMGGDASTKTHMQPEKGAAYGADADAYDYGFQDVDRNKDGFISREEAKEHEDLDTNWDTADTDRDGKLSESEFSAFEDREPDANSDKK